MIISALLTILGLSLFETVSSIDNAIINAEVLHTMEPKARRWFLTWGFLFSVFIARGLLPLIIISIFKSQTALYIFAGLFLVLLFLQWFFDKEESILLKFIEKFFMKRGFSSDTSKIIFLEVIDFVFSVDGVIGAFAFTLSIPLILIGNGLGAFFVRRLTVGNIARIKKYVYLKNGAMYSILVLGIIMILQSFHYDIPEYVSPSATFIIIGFFFLKSKLGLSTNKIYGHKVPRRI
ncbi:MAG: DUF475 domain-containing protein [Patescibacteria group bacterium]